MSIARSKLEAELASKVPNDILKSLLDEYQHIKQQFFLGKFQPAELNGARFCECVLRLLELLSTGVYTPFGNELRSPKIITDIEKNTSLPDTIRVFIPRLVRVVLDVRNKRDVAHVGGEVSANYSDSLLVVHATDWILVELVRHFHTCPIAEAQKVVSSITETKIPIIAEVDGFVRIQNTNLDAKAKVLVILYYKKPNKVKDTDLARWSKYANVSRLRSQILSQLDNEALIHYIDDSCSLLPKGVAFVERTIPFDLLA